MLFSSRPTSERTMVEVGAEAWFPVVPPVGLCSEERQNGFSVPGNGLQVS